MDKGENVPVETIPEPDTDGMVETKNESLEGIWEVALEEDLKHSHIRMYRRFLSGLEHVLPWGGLILIGTVLFGVAVSLLVWLLHIWLPMGGRWLEEERIDRLQAMFFSGISGAFITSFLRWYFVKK